MKQNKRSAKSVKKQTFSQFLAETANRFMPEEDIELDDDTVEIDDEGGELEDLEGDLEGDELEGEDEETPMISVEDAIRAIQLVINGDAESAEDALDMVQDLEGEENIEGDELGDELASDEEDIEDVEECNASPVEEGDEEVADIVDEEDDVEEGDENEQYGESHSRFLKMSQRYL